MSFGEVLKRAQSVQIAIPAMQCVRGKLLDCAVLLLALAGVEVKGDVELRAELRAVRMQKQGYLKSLLDLARCQCDITQTVPLVIDNAEYPWPNMSAGLLSDFAHVVIDKDSIVTNMIEIHLLARVQKALNNVHLEAVGSHLKAVSPDQFGNIAQVGSMITRLIANGMSDKFVQQLAEDIAANSESAPLEVEKQFVQTVVELLKFTPPREWFVAVSELGGCRYTHSEAGFIIDVCVRTKVVVALLRLCHEQLFCSDTQEKEMLALTNTVVHEDVSEPDAKRRRGTSQASTRSSASSSSPVAVQFPSQAIGTFVFAFAFALVSCSHSYSHSYSYSRSCLYSCSCLHVRIRISVSVRIRIRVRSRVRVRIRARTRVRSRTRLRIRFRVCVRIRIRIRIRLRIRFRNRHRDSTRIRIRFRARTRIRIRIRILGPHNYGRFNTHPSSIESGRMSSHRAQSKLLVGSGFCGVVNLFASHIHGSHQAVAYLECLQQELLDLQPLTAVPEYHSLMTTLYSIPLPMSALKTLVTNATSFVKLSVAHLRNKWLSDIQTLTGDLTSASPDWTSFISDAGYDKAQFANFVKDPKRKAKALIVCLHGYVQNVREAYETLNMQPAVDSDPALQAKNTAAMEAMSDAKVGLALHTVGQVLLQHPESQNFALLAVNAVKSAKVNLPKSVLTELCALAGVAVFDFKNEYDASCRAV